MSQVEVANISTPENMSDNYRGRGRRGQRSYHQGNHGGQEFYNTEFDPNLYGMNFYQPIPNGAVPQSYGASGQYFDSRAEPMWTGPPHRGRGHRSFRGSRSGQGHRHQQYDQDRVGDSYSDHNMNTTPSSSYNRGKHRQRQFHQSQTQDSRFNHHGQNLPKHEPPDSYQGLDSPNMAVGIPEGQNRDVGEHRVNRNSKKQAYGYQRQVRPKTKAEPVPERESKSASDVPSSEASEAMSSRGSSERGARGKGQGARGGRGGRGGHRGGSGGHRGGRGSYQKRKNEVENDETQRGRLIEELSINAYECMVCCEIVRKEAPVWSCRSCYHIFHLPCIKKWARTPAATVLSTTGGSQGGWRCPSCQNVSQTFPSQYRCYCGKVRDPEWNHFETPHSCGGVCGREGPTHCTHPCTLVCHPGPCPPCHASVIKGCQCGKTKQTVRCGQAPSLQCTQTCDKTLNCGRHQCQRVCHAGACEPCQETVTQECYCVQEKRDLVCGSKDSFVSSYTCQNICNRSLGCGEHRCPEPCHPGECAPCALLPEAVTTCPCGRTSLQELLGAEGARTSCKDPIPSCKHICDKPLPCGPADDPHRCMLPCHPSLCEGCEGTTPVRCRCAALTSTLSCKEAMTFNPTNPYTCDRRCNKKLSCGRHRCPNKCCVEKEHKCVQVCGRRLTCQLHRCEEPCHHGNCPTCWHVSFDELRCECGVEVLFPPIPCGATPPECHQPCTRTHVCDHKVVHNCHSEEQCPPCTQLTEKWCHGKHERRKNIACHVTEVSCGHDCGRDLPCGQHKCVKMCHKGECMETGETCQQPCTTRREQCSHPCSATCHPGKPCPPHPCKAKVEMRCECGQRVETMPCGQQDKPDPAASAQYQALNTSMLAMKIAGAQDGQTFDISSLTKQQPAPTNTNKKLECSAECAQMERNKRLALALQISNPDVSSKLGPPQYTQFLKDYARQNASFVASVEGSLRTVVEMAQKSKQPRRSHAFTPMKSVQRRVVHELAEYYGCETQSYDEEPNKNVVATAVKGKCWLPSISLTSLIQRELHPKAPTPIPYGSSTSQIQSAAQAARQSTALIGRAKPAVGPAKKAWGPPPTAKQEKPASGANKEPVIDYFDMTD